MSSKKNFDSRTKIHDEVENTDSGFLSGPLSEQLVSEDCDVTSEIECQRDESGSEPLQLDSGLDLCLTESLSNIHISDDSVQTPTAQTAPLITIVDDSNQDVPPLALLFQQDDDGDTQLHIAAVHGCQKSVGTLIRVCPEKNWFNVPNDYGQTALHLAVLGRQAIVTRMLIQAGATLGIRDCAGETPLHIAASAGDTECLQALLAPLPGQPQRRLAATLNQKNFTGQTCVHLAARSGHVDAIHILVFYGADVNAREGLCGWTALHVAAARGDAATARYLLEKCPGVAAGARDYAGRTPRRLAAAPLSAPLATPLAALLAAHRHSDDDDDDDDTLYDSDESLFDRLREGMSAINVA